MLQTKRENQQVDLFHQNSVISSIFMIYAEISMIIFKSLNGELHITRVTKFSKAALISPLSSNCHLSNIMVFPSNVHRRHCHNACVVIQIVSDWLCIIYNSYLKPTSAFGSHISHRQLSTTTDWNRLQSLHKRSSGNWIFFSCMHRFLWIANGLCI